MRAGRGWAAITVGIFAVGAATLFASERADGIAEGPETAPLFAVDSLDFAFYREQVEPIFLRERDGVTPGRAACVLCHTWQTATPLPLEPLAVDADGNVFWTEEQSRRNYAAVSRLVTPGHPEVSRLLRQPLATAAGGSTYHSGGKYWESMDDPEWQVLAEWVEAAEEVAMEPGPPLDFDFFMTCVQPIFIQPVEGAVGCASCHTSGANGFARPIPEGREFWNEEESRQNFSVAVRFIEPGYPERSRLLMHPLHPDAGGSYMHNGGRRWMSQDDPEWQMLAEWVRGERSGDMC